MKTRTLLSAVVAPLALSFILVLPAYAQTLDRQLDIGATGSDVSSLQDYLAVQPGIYTGPVTGYYGPLTAAAVARWQTANGIAAVGRVGPITLAALNLAMSGQGNGSLAPAISSVTVATTSNSASISWISDQPAQAMVMYNTTWPFLYASAPKVSGSASLSTTQNVTLTGLQPNTTYYYVVQSTDQSGLYSWTIAQSFTTGR